jgi:hypothetical protein
MKRLFVLSLLAVAACNTSQSGANNAIAFTPDNCGELGGCDFADSIGVGGKIDVTISGLNGTPTAGLDLASADTDVFDVAPTEDVGGEPAWEITAYSPGVARLAAIDGDGNEIDFIEVPVQEVTRLTMEPFAGDIVGPTEEDGVDEVFTVNADALVSWSVRPIIAGDVTTMGRYTFANTQAVDLSQYETESSDPANGYLYVQLPVGEYPITFELADDGEIYVSAVIRAQ